MMATYYWSQGSERDSQNMYSREALGNLLYLNNPASGPYTEFQQDCIEMTEAGHPSSLISSARESDMLGSHQGQGLAKDMKNEMLMHMMDDGSQSSAADLIDDDAHNGVQLDFGVLNNHGSLNEIPSVVQGQALLSLSLNTQIMAPYWPIKPDDGGLGVDDIRMKSVQHKMAIRNSRYLKAAQELLDEAVSVWKNMKQKEPGKTDGRETEAVPSDPQASSGATTAVPELSTAAAERQELQNRMAKLMAMLDEVDRKYKHYHHQMQSVVSSFDVVAGPRAARPYTAVALQTISRHFWCLKDAVNDQINVVRKKLGVGEEEESSSAKLTRLRYIDQQLRQQRAFQQYGVTIPQNAWRPQRGLPENSVTILRAWLFEHFLHPYPQDSEKLMLSRQTGLTRSQISNWFINARVRLWKPMIEDMYKEEIGDDMEQDSNSCSDKQAPRSKAKVATSQDKEDLQVTSCTPRVSPLSESRASMGLLQNEPNLDDSFMNLMLKDQHQDESNAARFMAYHHLAELGRYGNGNVSLTLGLHHSSASLSVPGISVGVGDDDIYNYNATAPIGVSVASSDYESMDQWQRFEQSSPLVHDFVAASL